MLKKIELIVNKFNIYNVVIHPSNVSNWDVFNNFQHLPLSIENMDRSNKKGKTVEDIEYLINKYNFNLTLDLNHCLSNDESMELAREFHDRLGDRIVEYHISGYDKEKPHVPLYTVGQKEIIEALELKDKVIIIESEFNKIGEEIKEFEYIIDNLE